MSRPAHRECGNRRATPLARARATPFPRQRTDGEPRDGRIDRAAVAVREELVWRRPNPARDTVDAGWPLAIRQRRAPARRERRRPPPKKQNIQRATTRLRAHRPGANEDPPPKTAARRRASGWRYVARISSRAGASLSKGKAARRVRLRGSTLCRCDERRAVWRIYHIRSSTVEYCQAFQSGAAWQRQREDSLGGRLLTHAPRHAR